MDRNVDLTVEVPECPDALDQIENRLRKTVDDLVRFIRQDTAELSLMDFECRLGEWIALLFRLGVALFLAARHARLDLGPWCAEGWRVKREFAERTIKTLYGPVRYGRAYLIRKGSRGWFPLDAVLGITRDGFSWRVIAVATRLSTRVSYSASRKIMKFLLGWSLSTEAIESLAIGLGSRAPAFMESFGPPDGDGEVLVIEVDGKAAPMATKEELDARRQKRKHASDCPCGCQRHRGRQRRQGKAKKRKKRGHNSKNGRSATLVAMYTLHRGADGRLHGPINKSIWGQFGCRKNMLQWARDQATRRGFPPDTVQRIQIVLDGECCLRKELQILFPHATFTLDVRHAEERLWKVGRLFYPEASKELGQFVEPLNVLLLNGRADVLLEQLREMLEKVPPRGPGTKTKREVLGKQIAFFDPRRDLMHYDEYRRDDLVLATGVIEGACRYVVKERLDCSGMRWTLQGAERLLQLRCIELNGDWEAFIAWASKETAEELAAGKFVQIRPPKPKPPSKIPRKPAKSAA